MNLILMIAGREAVPVRAIPLLTSWENLSPDEVARALARHEGFENFADLAAYWLESGEPREVEDVFWEHYVVRKIEDLELQDLDTEQWQEKSIATLPAWAFVWRDDLVRCYLAEYGWNDDGEPAEPDAPLNFNPLVPSELGALAMQGFDAPGTVGPVDFDESAQVPPSACDRPASPANGLATAQIATIFDGIKFRAENWTKRLSEANWPKPALVARGAAGGATSLWDPFILASLIHVRERGEGGREMLAVLNKKFNTNQALAPWRSAWDEHYSMFSDAD